MKIKMSVILLILFAKFTAAQQQVPIKELKIGDTIPIEMVLGKMINAPQTSMKVSDSKADLIILDFWATWCAPCIGFFKDVDVLQKEFKERIQVIPITDQSEAIAVSFLKDMQKVKGFLPSSIVEDKILHQLFPHVYIPHEVWINRHGVIKAITGYDEVNSKNITKFLSNEDLSLPVKKDVELKNEDSTAKPLYMGDQAGFLKPSDGLLYYSIFTAYDPALASQDIWEKKFIRSTSGTVLGLYQMAMGRFRYEFGAHNRAILKVKDSTKFFDPSRKYSKDWMHANSYNYELTILDTVSFDDNMKFDIMLKDLNVFFGAKLGIEGKMEKRKVMCWVLERTSKADKLETKGGLRFEEINRYKWNTKNFSLFYFISQMQSSFQQVSPLPLIDNTGYKGKVDLELNCDLSGGMSAINAELKKYDLAFVKKEMLIDMIVISDIKKGK